MNPSFNGVGLIALSNKKGDCGVFPITTNSILTKQFLSLMDLDHC